MFFGLFNWNWGRGNKIQFPASVICEGIPEERDQLIEEIRAGRISVNDLSERKSLLKFALSLNDPYRARIVPILLRYGADPNYKRTYQYHGAVLTSYTISSFYGFGVTYHTSLARLLLSYGLELEPVRVVQRESRGLQSMLELPDDYFQASQTFKRAEQTVEQGDYEDAIGTYQHVQAQFEVF